MKIIAIVFAVLCFCFPIACSQNTGDEQAQQQNAQPEMQQQPAQQQEQPPSSGSAPVAPYRATSSGQAVVHSAAGIQWTVPAQWKPQPERPMRVATYTIPPGSTDSEPGECAVFFFGSGQGGDVRSNIQRWISQFEEGAASEESSGMVNGLPITTVSIEGTYLAPGGPMMQSQGKKPNYRLLGGIAEAPQGAVFFKTTGPVATMKEAEDEFQALMNSITKASN